MNIEDLARIAVDCGLRIHRELGPGLLESVYETVLFRSIEKTGLHVERQKAISFTFDDMRFEDAFRVDLLIDGKLLIELKSVEKAAPVHGKQVLTYLRLMNLPLGLLMNFGMATFKEGVQRIVNHHKDFAASRARGAVILMTPECGNPVSYKGGIDRWTRITLTSPPARPISMP